MLKTEKIYFENCKVYCIRKSESRILKKNKLGAIGNIQHLKSMMKRERRG